MTDRSRENPAPTSEPEPAAAKGSEDSPTATLPEELRSTLEARSSGAPPQAIGPYRLLSPLGEGGMGEVWEAEQTSPIRRRVAVKLIKRGLDSKRVLARFASERQALALMDHPYIAKVLDAGSTEQGSPYFVMELVRGLPITDYCDRHRLTTAQRLELFTKVCEGVQHAHHKAIIHRDLKPSNVLVAEHDGRATPKVIDFGVAKATAQRLTEHTVHTELGQLIGTPEYMSPEQAELTGEDIDTRTDVYALGVLLYVLLVGALPFDPRALRRAGFDEIRRHIREEIPPRPSTRLGTLGDTSTTCAAARQTDPGHLASQLRGDLDWIVLKALEKERSRRYGSPAELAEDIRRHLSNEPVLATPPSSVYRLRKFTQRHRVGVAAAAAVALSLVAGLIASTWGLVRATRAEATAQREAAVAQQVSEFLVDLFEQSDPSHSRGESITAREVLDVGVRRIRAELDQETEGTSGVKASLLETMGRVYTSLGLYDDAVPLLEQGLELRQRRAGEEPLALARVLEELAATRSWQGDNQQALELAERSLEMRERELDPDHLEVAESLNTLGNILQNLDRGPEALAAHERAVSLRQAGLGPDDIEVGRSLHNLAIAYLEQGDLARAEELFRRAVEIEERAEGEDSYDLATGLHVLAIVLERQNREREAIPIEERALAIRERVLGPDHPHVAFSLTTLGNLYTATGRAGEAVPLLGRAIAIGEQSWHALHPEVRWMRRSRARALGELGRYREAEEALARLLSESEGSDEVVPLSGLLPTLDALGWLFTRAGRFDEAEAVLQRTLEMEERVSGSDSPFLAEHLNLLVELRRAQLREDEIGPLCERAVQLVAPLPEQAPERRNVLRACEGE